MLLITLACSSEYDTISHADEPASAEQETVEVETDESE